MSRSLTLELSDEHYETAVSTAEAAGKTLSEWMSANVVQLLSREAPARSFESFSPEVQSAIQKLAASHGGTLEQYAADFWNQIGPKPKKRITDDELAAARERLRQFSGCCQSGNRQSADNDQIDADLAAEYAGGHSEAA